MTSRSDPKHTPPTLCLCSEGDGVKTCCCLWNSFQSALNGNEIQSAFLYYTPPCWIICFLGCIAAADGPPLAPLPFKVKQALHSAPPHSQREETSFLTLRLFFALPTHALTGKKFPFWAPQLRAGTCCSALHPHTAFFSAWLSHIPVFQGVPNYPNAFSLLNGKILWLLPESMRQPYYPCWIIPCGRASVAGELLYYPCNLWNLKWSKTAFYTGKRSYLLLVPPRQAKPPKPFVPQSYIHTQLKGCSDDINTIQNTAHTATLPNLSSVCFIS